MALIRHIGPRNSQSQTQRPDRAYSSGWIESPKSFRPDVAAYRRLWREAGCRPHQPGFSAVEGTTPELCQSLEKKGQFEFRVDPLRITEQCAHRRRLSIRNTKRNRALFKD